MAIKKRLMAITSAALAVGALAITGLTSSAADTGTWAFTGSGGLNGSNPNDKVEVEGQLVPAGTGGATVVFSCQSAVVDEASATGVGCLLEDMSNHIVGGACCRFLPGQSSNQESEVGGLPLQQYQICVSGYYMPVYNPNLTIIKFADQCVVPQF